MAPLLNELTKTQLMKAILYIYIKWFRIHMPFPLTLSLYSSAANQRQSKVAFVSSYIIPLILFSFDAPFTFIIFSNNIFSAFNGWRRQSDLLSFHECIFALIITIMKFLMYGNNNKNKQMTAAWSRQRFFHSSKWRRKNLIYFAWG